MEPEPAAARTPPRPPRPPAPPTTGWYGRPGPGPDRGRGPRPVARQRQSAWRWTLDAFLELRKVTWPRGGAVAQNAVVATVVLGFLVALVLAVDLAGQLILPALR